MTTLVATRTAIYTDSQCSGHLVHKTAKAFHLIHKPKDGPIEDYLVAMCGDAREGKLLMALLESIGLNDLWKLHTIKDGIPDAVGSEDWDTELLVVTREKQIYTLDNFLTPLVVNEEFTTHGSGRQWAFAAMELAGKSPEEAIEYAATRDPYTKAPVQKLTFPRKRPE